MELQAARRIIDTLAQGIHPVTGEAMPEDSPYNAPPVIRALFAVSQALDGLGAPKPRRSRADLPPNTGKPWSSDDDEQLRLGFTAGTPTKDLAAALGHTRCGHRVAAGQAGVGDAGELPPGAPVSRAWLALGAGRCPTGEWRGAHGAAGGGWLGRFAARALAQSRAPCEPAERAQLVAASDSRHLFERSRRRSELCRAGVRDGSQRASVRSGAQHREGRYEPQAAAACRATPAPKRSPAD